MVKPGVLAVIPARGGSKGIVKKNIRLFNGKALLAHAIEASRRAPSVSRIIVSTDDPETAEIARNTGAEVPFLRPSEFSSDSSNVADAVVHLLNELKKNEGYEPDYIVLLQPTNPMRTSDDIEKALTLIQGRDADSLVSIYKTSEPLILTKDESDSLTFINSELFSSPNRQQMPAYYRLDGCMLFIVRTKTLLEKRSFFAGKIVGYEIERWRAIDIDEPQDFVLGELVHAHRDEIVQSIANFSNSPRI